MNAAYPTTCPNCQADLQGGEIPEKAREAYGGKTHFSRCWGLYDTKKDRTTMWMCPDCGHKWQRGGDADGSNSNP